MKGPLKMAGRAVAAVLLAALGLGLMAFQFVYPDVSRLARQRPEKTSFMEYRQRQWEREGRRKEIVWQWVPLSLISPYAVKAVIIAEDDKFWSHDGFDFEALQKALEKDLKKRRFKAGGSTITQQLAKNLFLTPERSLVRKAREAILAWRLERNLSKRRILELYLNVAEWGDALFGIEAASRRYFGKPASALSPREAALLAAVLPNPLRYNPADPGPYVQKRAEAIYRIMLRRGIVIPEYEELVGDKADQNRGIDHPLDAELEGPGARQESDGEEEGAAP